jgi:histidinol-phosphatase
MAPTLDDDLALALRLADEADVISMRWFSAGAVPYEDKDDGSPVTEADPEIEQRLLTIVGDERPGDAFLGEEVGAHGAGPRRWIVDGIDGTIVFIHGGTGWGTQIALEVDGEVVLGVSTSPAFGWRWWARRGGGAWRQPTGLDTPPTTIRVSERASLDGAASSFIPPLDRLRSQERAAAERVVSKGSYLEPEQHAALMVAEGIVDTSYQPTGGPWDFAALAVIVEEAGGTYSDGAGAWTIEGGGPAIYSNGRLHEATLVALAGPGGGTRAGGG